MKTMKKLGIALAAGLMVHVGAHAAYPDKPIRLVVPYAAGGATDGLSRALAEGMSRELGQPVVVDNKPGAGTIVGTQAVATAAKDGYTILMATNGNIVMAPLIYKKLTFDPNQDLRVFAIATEVPSVALVPATMPVNNLREFEAYAKAAPGGVFFAMLGQGNVLYATTKVMESMMGLKMTGVGYKGSAPALNAIMAGEVQLYVDLTSTSVPLVNAGKMKALAVPNNKRLEALPNVPTFAESGYPGFHAVTWLGLAIPTGSPDDRVKVLETAARKVIADPKFREIAVKLGMVMLPDMNPQAITTYLAADRERWATQVKRFDIKVEE